MIRITSSTNGVVTKVIELEATEERLSRIRAFSERMKENKERMKREMEERFSKIPPIHIEILKLANTVGKEELLNLYPEHETFINSIQ